MRRLHNHRRLSQSVRHSALLGWTVAGHHITDAGTVALTLAIREFVGNDRNAACRSHELGHEGGWCQHPLEPPSVCLHGGRKAVGEPIVRCLWCERYISSR